MSLKNRLNNKQFYALEVNNYWKPEILMLDGAFRSGKSVLNNIVYPQHIEDFRGRHVDFIMTGHSIGSLERNVLKPMRDDFGINTNLDKYSRFELFGNMVNCFGTEKANSDESMQGMTAYGWLANELTLSHQRAFKMAMSRCSGVGARKFWDMNPGAPQHHLHKTYIEPWIREGNNRQLCRINWKMRDNDIAHNGYLTEEYIQGMEKDYTGVWHKKYIQGLWVAQEGQIYFLENLQYYDDAEIESPGWFDSVIIHGMLDPAAGSKKKTGCFTSIITAAKKGDRLYVLDAVVKKLGVRETIQSAGEMLKKWNYSRFLYEDNFSQEEYVGRPLKEAFPFSPIKGQSSREDKLSRLTGMEGVIYSKVYFPERFLHERNSDGWLLLQQLCNISKEDIQVEGDEQYLDGPDALEGLIRSYGKNTISQGANQGGGTEAKNDW